jgi:thiol:disulfide interchange protein DsbD
MLGQKLGSGKPSLHNTFAMGIGAGFVAAPCTGPILAALLAYTARQESSVVASSVLLLVYSIGFGLPYMALGGAASKMSQIKLNPMIQIGVKILFASVMFGLALYYLRIPFYGFIETMRGSWQPIAISFLSIGVLVLGVWLSSPILAANKLATILPTTLLGIGIFATSQWLTTANASGRSVAWVKDEAEAFRLAQATGKPVLIDMWAEWCEACKKMDATTFKDSLILDEVERYWIPLKLDLTELDEKSEKIQSHYNVQSLPTLVLSAPTKDHTRYKNLGGFVEASTLIQHLAEYRDQLR